MASRRRLCPPHFLSHSSLRGRFGAIRTDSGQFPAVLSSALSGPHLARFVAGPLTETTGQRTDRSIVVSVARERPFPRRKGAWRSAMSSNEDGRDDNRDPLDPSPQVPSEIPVGLDRRKFIMRSAVISAAAVMTGCSRADTEKAAPPPTPEAAAQAPSTPPLAPELNVVQKEKGPVL